MRGKVFFTAQKGKKGYNYKMRSQVFLEDTLLSFYSPHCLFLVTGSLTRCNQ